MWSISSFTNAPLASSRGFPSLFALRARLIEFFWAWMVSDVLNVYSCDSRGLHGQGPVLRREHDLDRNLLYCRTCRRPLEPGPAEHDEL